MADVLPFPSTSTAGASATSSTPPDHEARATALDIRRSFIVEAPAGSGKTGLLIQRFLKLLTDSAVTSPEQVLAITFTNKATAEMRDRVLGQLQAAVNGQLRLDANSFDQLTHQLAREVLERDRQLGWLLLDNPLRLRIRTIDALCNEIARTLPVLTGSGGSLTPIEDAGVLHREAARRTILQFGGDDSRFNAALRDLLLHRDGNLGECEALISEMLSLRDQWGSLFPLNHASLDDEYLDANVRPRLEHSLERVICSTLTHVADGFPTGLLDDLSALAADMAECMGINGNASPIAWCKGRRNAPGAAAEHLDHWRMLIPLLITSGNSRDWRKRLSRRDLKFEIEKHHVAQLKDLIAQISARPHLLQLLHAVDVLPPAKYPEEQWQLAKSLFRVLSAALIQLQFVFAERNECDFTELGLLARSALRQHSGVEDLSAAIGSQLQHLLVDEMQDTSTGQYELIELLTSSWDGHSQTVFLVGDPRQSIYLFRQARVERFIQALEQQRIGELPLTRLRLTANFRSQQDLVMHFNRDFTRIFSTSPSEEEIPYCEADAILQPSQDADGRMWHTSTIEYVSKTRSEDSLQPSAAEMKRQARQTNAVEILRIVQRWMNRPLPPGRRTIRDEAGNSIAQPWSFAVLVSNRRHLTEIVTELRQQTAISYRAIDIDLLNERQEILDLTALTRTLLHPGDRVAALATLRAPWCGLSLAELYTLAGGDDSGLRSFSVQRLAEDRASLLSEDSRRRLQRILDVSREAARMRSRLTTAQLVERAWRSLGGDSWLDETQLANTRRFFQLLDSIEAEGGVFGSVDLLQLEGRLQRLYAEPEHVPPSKPFVELLTIHKAKGLEWDVVFVPSLEAVPGNGDSRLLTWSELNNDDTQAAEGMLSPIAARGGDASDLTKWLQSMQGEREAAERKRLFYVACTRAREELHLFATPKTKQSGDVSVHSKSLLKAAWGAAEEEFANPPTTRASMLEQEGEGPIEIAAEETQDASTPQLTIPFQDSSSELLDSAVAANRPVLQRLPLAFDPRARMASMHLRTITSVEADTAPEDSTDRLVRPEGSFAARSFGNVVHAVLEQVASRLAEGTSVTDLQTELPLWSSRIAALLRSDGLSRIVVDRLADEALRAVQQTLRDEEGLWVLTPKAKAANEFALVNVHGQRMATSIRADRIFQAGAAPHLPGEDHLWIIDYKTASHSGSEMEKFLDRQRETYAAQLNSYAHALAPVRSVPATKIRLGLYFPALPRLIWWSAAEAVTPE